MHQAGNAGRSHRPVGDGRSQVRSAELPAGVRPVQPGPAHRSAGARALGVCLDLVTDLGQLLPMLLLVALVWWYWWGAAGEWTG